MRRLAGDLFQVAGGDLGHPFDAAAYLLLGPEPVLFDCGSADGHAPLVAALRALGVAPADLAGVCATHGHYDHLSGLAPLRALADVPLWLHPTERAGVERGDGVATAALALYRREFPPLRVDHALGDGDTLTFGGHRVEVVHTPGHSPGSTSFIVATGGRRVLLAGDALWGGFHPSIGSAIDDWADSLEHLLEHDFDAMSFGHGVDHLVLDAHAKVAAARDQLGVYYNPWFSPPHLAA